MPTETKEIGDRTMSREKPLGLTWGLKLVHLTFPLPCWLMRDFGAAVKARALAVRHTGQGIVKLMDQNLTAPQYTVVIISLAYPILCYFTFS
jgi:hypothetical protein